MNAPNISCSTGVVMVKFLKNKSFESFELLTLQIGFITSESCPDKKIKQWSTEGIITGYMTHLSSCIMNKYIPTESYPCKVHVFTACAEVRE